MRSARCLACHATSRFRRTHSTAKNSDKLNRIGLARNPLDSIPQRSGVQWQGWAFERTLCDAMVTPMLIAPLCAGGTTGRHFPCGMPCRVVYLGARWCRTTLRGYTSPRTRTHAHARTHARTHAPARTHAWTLAHPIASFAAACTHSAHIGMRQHRCGFMASLPCADLGCTRCRRRRSYGSARE